MLDLGCGFGWYARWFTATARGVDISERMLARAREMTPLTPGGDGDGNSKNGAVTFDRADLEEINLPAGVYDLVFSALALHYVSDLRRLLAQVHASLKPGGGGPRLLRGAPSPDGASERQAGVYQGRRGDPVLAAG